MAQTPLARGSGADGAPATPLREELSAAVPALAPRLPCSWPAMPRIITLVSWCPGVLVSR
ncbi:hypothetical protein [Streptomyces uncialis]|uniref:hypothetical protein n=1 Tax=Streptomyces uncialis TaxID=1048205 RepID=UPI0022506A42|nr:hypothetical protein [Streptomyces uncialis]MCX4658701.1 hypothetical protein [Streptomyces uncialis]